MSQPSLHWNRYLRTRTGTIDLSDEGFLRQPLFDPNSGVLPEIVRFADIAEIPCLVLLGELGMGKSHLMQTEYQKLFADIRGTSDRALLVNLGLYGDENRLLREIFENPEFVKWHQGQHQLYLFLDSLDECLVQVRRVTGILANEFSKYSRERLFLRLACRTSEWANSFEKQLSELWGDSATQVFELTPLTRQNVIEAANAYAVDADAFIQEVRRKDVTAFAINPVTLQFLLNVFRTSNTLPATRTELYERGCRYLCEDPNEERRDADLIGDLSPDIRLSIASRIAALSIFGKKSAIWTGMEQVETVSDDLLVREILGTERKEELNIQLNEQMVRETLSTGLFSSRGSQRMGWAHQTYGEFLAALYVTRHNLDMKQILSLVQSAQDPYHKIVPQLQEAAAWIANMRADIFDAIVGSEPEILLRADIATSSPENRTILTQSLLNHFEQGKLHDRDWELNGRYAKLAHPGLDEQLKPYVLDRNKTVLVRRNAIEIAEACRLTTLQRELLNLSLDDTESLPVRVSAAFSLSKIGDNETKSLLRNLALQDNPTDEQDDLKGSALFALWPQQVTTQEVLGALTPPKRSSYFGIYEMFLSRQLVPHVPLADLPFALEWVGEQIIPESTSIFYSDILDGIIVRAWEHLDAPGVLDAFARTALKRLRNHHQLVGPYSDLPALNQDNFVKRLLEHSEKRHWIVEALVPLISEPAKEMYLLAYSRQPLIVHTDLEWVLDHLKTAQSKQAQDFWLAALPFVFDLRDRNQTQVVSRLGKKIPSVASVLAQMRKQYKRGLEIQKKWERERKDASPLIKPPPAERIAHCLDAIKAGKTEQWWNLNLQMSLEKDSRHYSEREADLTTLPGWKNASDEIRTRILHAAELYLIHEKPDDSVWEPNTLHRPSMAAYRAFLLLRKQTPAVFEKLPNEIWQAWSPVFFTYPNGLSSSDIRELHHEVVAMAYARAQKEITDCLLVMLDREDKAGSGLYTLNHLELCWDENLKRVLMELAKNKEWKPASFGSLLRELLRHGVDEAKVLATSTLTVPIAQDGDARERALLCAQALAAHANDAGWSTLWHVILNDTTFGHELVERLANRFETRESHFFYNLREQEVADLFLWLEEQFPHEQDPQVEGTHSPSSREMIGQWRNMALQSLERRGTLEACRALERIIALRPDLEYPRWVLVDAQKRFRRDNWTPPNPEAILTLAANHEYRLVQNGDQLLATIVDSLRRLGRKLHGETPMVQFLWDAIGRDEYRPKEEAAVSDLVQIHLEDDLKGRGIILNREVQIRRGERTDIHVDAISHSSTNGEYERITVIIETKGSWNRDLEAAMRTQLYERYLLGTGTHHGIYLIGWFNSASWSQRDRRRRAAARRLCPTKEWTQQHYDEQARELSSSESHIECVVLDTSLE